MFSSFLLFCTVALAGILEPQAGCGETATRVCYGIDGGTAQNISLDDVQYAADFLRYTGENAQGEDKFWTMPKALDCDEWTLPLGDGQTVLALAKHIHPRKATSVLYTDMANTIDGGVGAPDATKQKALFGCGTNGGSLGVVYDPNDAAYNTPEYKAKGATPDGIIIKLVRDPKSQK